MIKHTKDKLVYPNDEYVFESISLIVSMLEETSSKKRRFYELGCSPVTADLDGYQMLLSSQTDKR